MIHDHHQPMVDRTAKTFHQWILNDPAHPAFKQSKTVA